MVNLTQLESCERFEALGATFSWFSGPLFVAGLGPFEGVFGPLEGDRIGRFSVGRRADLGYGTRSCKTFGLFFLHTRLRSLTLYSSFSSYISYLLLYFSYIS